MIGKTTIIICIIICIFIGIVFFYSFNIQKNGSLESHIVNGIYFKKICKKNTSFFDFYQLDESLGQTAYGIATADFNNDGWMDFIVSYATKPFKYSTVSLFINKENLTFKKEDIFSFNYSYIKDLDANDFDGDGYIDLVFSFNEFCWIDNLSVYTNGSLVLAKNDGCGNFHNFSLIFQSIFLDEINKEKRINLKLTSADYDNDGDNDIIIGDNSGNIELLFNQGNGSFNNKGIIHDFGRLSWGVASFDINNDKNIDLIVAAEFDNYLDSVKGSLYYYLNDGTNDCFANNNFSRIINISSVYGTCCLLPIDFDGDGINEIILGMADTIEGYSINPTDDKYRFINKLKICFELFKDDLTRGGIACGDFNGDGKDDFVTGGTQGIIRMFINRL